jgi:trehalose 6-phosphate synthase/phosphatase
VLFSDNPMQGDAQETGLMGRTRSSTNDSFDEDWAELASKAVPVTPGVHTAGHSAYFEAKREPGEADQRHVHYDDVSSGPYWNANTYHAPKEEDAADGSPRVAATDAKSAEEVLRVLELTTTGDSSKKELTDIDPRAAHPGLGLSGHIINATFIVPYSISFAPDKEWVSWKIPL